MQSIAKIFNLRLTLHEALFYVAVSQHELFLTLHEHFFPLLLFLLERRLSGELFFLGALAIGVKLSLLYLQQFSKFV
ncbi:hypothetical protein D3C85_1632840 [compost metagenome]